MVGSSPPAASTSAVIEVVVVLPAEPPIATPYFMRMSSASISARGITGMQASSAARSSGFVAGTADENTTTSAPSTSDASWPMPIRMPSSRMRRVAALSRRSEPDTE